MFELLIQAFNLILYQPLLNVLVLLYQYLPGHDFGIAVIVLTILIRLVLYPLTLKGVKSQKALQEIQPKIKEIQRVHKEDRAKQSKALMELYQKSKINPFSGCLPLLIQLPILIAVFRIFRERIGPEQMQYLYSFVSNPGEINPSFLGLIDLSQPFFLLALLCGISQYFQTKMLTPTEQKTAQGKKGTPDFSQMMQKQMLYFFPILTVFILLKLPSALGLYWFLSTLFAIFQQYLITKKTKKHA